MMRLARLSTIFFLLVTALLGTAWAKPEPPDHLVGIFEEFSELEQKFESERWDESLRVVEEIGEDFEQISPQLQQEVKASVLEDFSLILKNMKKAILKQDQEKTERNYIALQKLFFDVMDSYDYKIHPVLLIIDKYLGEAGEAVEEGDFDDLVAEMNEIEGFFKKARGLLAGKGAAEAELDAFAQGIQSARQDGGDRAAEQAQQTVSQLRQRFSAFLKLY